MGCCETAVARSTERVTASARSTGLYVRGYGLARHVPTTAVGALPVVVEPRGSDGDKFMNCRTTWASAAADLVQGACRKPNSTCRTGRARAMSKRAKRIVATAALLVLGGALIPPTVAGEWGSFRPCGSDEFLYDASTDEIAAYYSPMGKYIVFSLVGQTPKRLNRLLPRRGVV